MATNSIRRQVKNIVHNYTEAEVKVREATSNDPWGPSTSLMAEVSQMTYNGLAFPEVMMMIWRRLNDSGKNWRHVYKALTLLDYLLKNGSNKVVQECNENLISIQTLKDFQFLDKDGKDQGINVREKAKQIVALVKDEEKLKQERIQAQNTRRRMSKSPMAISNEKTVYSQGSSPAKVSSDLEQARPQSTGEEELQLQLALAMSKEEAEKKPVPSAPDEDELQLQAALSKSKEEYEKEMRVGQGDISLINQALVDYAASGEQDAQNTGKKNESHFSELFDLFGPTPTTQPTYSNIWGGQDVGFAPPTRSASHGSLSSPWGSVNQYANISSSLPWDSTPHITQLKEDNQSQSIIFGGETSPTWNEQSAVSTEKTSDPWANTTDGLFDANFDLLATPLTTSADAQPTSVRKPGSPLELDFGDFDPSTKPSIDALDLTGLEKSVPESKSKPRCLTPELFLEPAARSLVNLESLVSPPGSAPKNKNPFLSGLSAPSPNNPFQLGDQKPSLNQMRATSPVPPMGGTPLISTRTVSPVPPMSMGTGLNTLQAFPPMPGFPMPSTMPLLMPPTMGLQPPMNFSQMAPMIQLSQPFVPLSTSPSNVSSQAVNNPFL
ncbi:epsin-3 [Discoglossus pictus]